MARLGKNHTGQRGVIYDPPTSQTRRVRVLSYVCMCSVGKTYKCEKMRITFRDTRYTPGVSKSYVHFLTLICLASVIHTNATFVDQSRPKNSSWKCLLRRSVRSPSVVIPVSIPLAKLISVTLTSEQQWLLRRTLRSNVFHTCSKSK